MKPFWAFGLLLAIPAVVVVQIPHAPKPSVYAAAQETAPAACVKLVRSEPFPPDESPLPQYPDDAKEKHVEGDVAFHFEVGSGCATEEIAIDDGPEMLREPVATAVKNWKYCGVPEGQEIRATIAFRLSCPAK